MTSATEHARTVLAAIVPGRADLLDVALRNLNEAHFTDRVLGNIFAFLERYAEVTGGQLPGRDALHDILARRKLDAGTVAHYLEVFDALVDADADEGQFRWSLQELREQAAERATREALLQSMEILTQGAQDRQGNDLLGHAQAREHLLGKFAEIDRDLAMQDAPEGNMRGEGQEIIADYAARKAARQRGHGAGIEFGIPELDGKVGGLNPGDLVLLVAFTSEGKTSLCVQLAWNACVNQGKNVVFLTTETPRGQVRRRLVSRHSVHPAFDNPAGLNSKDIRLGALDPAGELMLGRVTNDFDHNPGYGTCWISQVPRGATMGYIESKLVRLQRLFPVDLVIMDYFALLRAERGRTSSREELSSILKDGKQVCTTFNDGVGVPMVTPWQVSRLARLQAAESGQYNPSALSETAEASNSPDVIISTLAPLDNTERYTQLAMQVMKHRDGERANAIRVDVDYATSRFGPVGSNGAALSVVHPGQHSVSEFDRLIERG